ncbi:MAG TPA: hypothetical protein VIF62_28325 [Labilithrix sp.]
MKLASPETARSARTIIAGILGIVGGGIFRATIHTSETSVWIPVVALVVAAGVAIVPHLGAQLLARGLWWSNLVLGAVLCFFGSSDAKPGAALVLGCGVALLLADRRALAAAADAREFRPAAFAGTVELVAILALADAQTMFLFGALTAGDRHGGEALVFFAAALGFVIGFVGLYRLRLWGVIVTMTTAALMLAALMLGNFLAHEDEIRRVLYVLSTVQLLAPMPMLASLATGRALPAASPRTRSILANVFVVAVMLASLGWAKAVR